MVFSQNGEKCANGNGEEVSSQEEEMEVEAPSTPDNQNGVSDKDAIVKSSGDSPSSESANKPTDDQKENTEDKAGEDKVSDSGDKPSDNEENTHSDNAKDTSTNSDDKEVET